MAGTAEYTTAAENLRGYDGMGMRGANGLEQWFWDGYVWRGEIAMNYVSKTHFQYKGVDFAHIYTEWFNKRKDAETKLKDGPAYNELLKTKFSMIDKEFEYYEDELAVLFEELATEKKERLKKVLVELGEQHELLATGYLEPGYEPDILLDFLKEIPGRMRFILKTLTSEKTKKVEPPCSCLMPEEHGFVKGKTYIKTEETGQPVSFCVAGNFVTR